MGLDGNDSRSEHRERRNAVLASSIQNLPGASKENGFPGWFVLPGVKPFRDDVKDLPECLFLNAEDMPKHERQPALNQVLRPWDIKDRKRLRLPLKNDGNEKQPDASSDDKKR